MARDSAVMPAMGGSLTPSEGGLSGRIAGAVLAATRRSIGLTQEALAEALNAGVTTVQAWESGRRPLLNLRHGDVRRLRRYLQVRGAKQPALASLDNALIADEFLAGTTGDIRTHPFATAVPNRAVTDLLVWPISGVTPQSLADLKGRLHVETGVRDAALVEWRRLHVDSPDDVHGAMIRRQVRYLLSAAPDASTWLASVDALERRRPSPGLSSWTPHWAVARSKAIASAAAGNVDALRAFIAVGINDATVGPNLTYWAYWSGEISDQWESDERMLHDDESWSGKRLAGTLIAGLSEAPYRDLNAHTLWALLRTRPYLVRDVALRSALLNAAEAVLSTPGLLEPAARQRLDQVTYLARSAA